MLPDETQRYLQTPPNSRRSFLKEGYLRHVPKASERERVMYHFERLVEFTRRLNCLECITATQPTIKTSSFIRTDQFTVVDLCAECIQESCEFMVDRELTRSWVAFGGLLEVIKLKPAAENAVQAAFLLLHLAALIMRRRILDSHVEDEPQIVSLTEGYTALARDFSPPLFERMNSSAQQLNKLSENIAKVAALFHERP